MQPITIKEAVDKLTSAIKADPELYLAYQANIAMPFFDKLTQEGRNLLLERGFNPHQIANDAAKSFLDLLCRNAPQYSATGVECITKERHEQINKHGFDATHDDYQEGELVEAALFSLDPKFEFADRWPEGWYDHFKVKIQQKSRIDQLTVAGAFIAAEIDRLLQQETSTSA